MNDRALQRLAWAVAALTLALTVGETVLGLVRGSSLSSVPAMNLGDVLSALPYATVPLVAAIISRSQPRNAIVWILCLAGLSTAVVNFASEYAYQAVLLHPGKLPLGQVARWLFFWAWVPGTFVPSLFLLLFPTGKPLSPVWRWVVSVGIGLAIAETAFIPLLPSDSIGVQNLPFKNPLGISALAGLARPLLGILFVSQPLLTVAAFLSVILRYRRSNPEQRLQLKWILYIAVLVPLSSILGVLTPQNFGQQPSTLLSILSGAVQVIGPVALPIVIGISMLKYRLYDIDIVLSRTLVYGSLAAFITAVYIAIVVGIGSLIGNGGQPNLGLSILATAIVAVAFQPVRERVQKVANRLVYGRRATPYEVLSQFGERVAEAYAGEAVLPHMARVLAEGVGAERADIWLHVGDQLRPRASWPDPTATLVTQSVNGRALTIPGVDRTVEVLHQGELLGALTVTKRRGESLTPIEEKLLTDLAGQAGLVLKNVRLTAELEQRLVDLGASRQRLVAAQDEERRRLERDIHDGAQQHLVAIKVKLGMARTLAEDDPGQARAAIGQLKTDADGALETLRDLARGICPPLLADRGLGAALEAQARKASLPVEVEAGGLDRYPQEIESAVYFCCLEALQNIARHARASRAVIRITREGKELRFGVEDNGIGFAPEPEHGSGLQNMRDRLDALGGALDIHSEPGSGTTLLGRLPL